ncbi:MAG: hypothetical protein EA427_15815 [Spirochaetaceae bacterium]|nr:MAG: hypothetical protein EA427_15815 [Spirochaetaceae bacterium]
MIKRLLLGAALAVGVFSCADLIYEPPNFDNPNDPINSGPGAVVTSLAWERATDFAPLFPRVDFGATVFLDRIWIAGGRDDSGPLEDIWSSLGGVSWGREVETGPLVGAAAENPAFIAFEDRLYLYGLADLHVSEDGINWSNVPAYFSGDFVRFVEMSGRLWAVAPESGEIYSSATPTVFDSWVIEDGGALLGTPGSTGTTVTAHDGAIWMIGRSLIDDVYRYVPGSGGWALVDSSGTYNRERAQVISFGGNLWMMGGLLEPEGMAAMNDVWRVGVGTHDEDLPRPDWEPRERFGTVVFKDRIYLFGGAENGTTGMHTDVWYAVGR